MLRASYKKNTHSDFSSFIDQDAQLPNQLHDLIKIINIVNKFNKSIKDNRSDTRLTFMTIGSFHGPRLDLRQPPSSRHVHEPPRKSGS